MTPYIIRLRLSFKKEKNSGGLTAQYSRKAPISTVMAVPKMTAGFPDMTIFFSHTVTFFCQNFIIVVSP